MALHVTSQAPAGATKLFEQDVPSGTLGVFDTGVNGYLLPPDFSSLWMIICGRSDTVAATTTLKLRFNNDSGANYHSQYLTSSATNVSAAENLNGTAMLLGDWSADSDTASYYSCAEILVPFYSGTSAFKPVLANITVPQLATTNSLSVFQSGGHWRSTSAINRVRFSANAGSFKDGSYLAVYGI